VRSRSCACSPRGPGRRRVHLARSARGSGTITRTGWNVTVADASFFLTAPLGKHLSFFIEFPMFESKAWEFTPTGPGDARIAQHGDLQLPTETPVFEVAKFWWNNLLGTGAPRDSVNLLLPEEDGGRLRTIRLDLRGLLRRHRCGGREQGPSAGMGHHRRAAVPHPREPQDHRRVPAPRVRRPDRRRELDLEGRRLDHPGDDRLLDPFGTDRPRPAARRALLGNVRGKRAASGYIWGPPGGRDGEERER